MSPDVRTRHALLALARGAIRAAIAGETPAGGDEPFEDDRYCGAFVSIHKGEELRGCVGVVETREPLGAEVARCAVAAATRDSRFPPVTLDELEGCRLEISLLTRPRPVRVAADVVVGRHGVIVEQSGRKGLLLPQVASEEGWDNETFLTHASRKAGLSPDAWRQGARIEIFEAEVFGESGY